MQASAQHAQPLVHMVQAKSFLNVAAPDSVIFDKDIQYIILPVYGNLNPFCLSMTNGICDALLYNAVNNVFLVRIEVV